MCFSIVFVIFATCKDDHQFGCDKNIVLREYKGGGGCPEGTSSGKSHCVLKIVLRLFLTSFPVTF